MFLKSFLENHVADTRSEVKNLIQLGARAVHVAQQLENYRTVVLMATDRKEIEAYLPYLHALGVDDTVYYPTPSLSPYEWTGEERLSAHQRHAVRYRLLNSENPPRCLLMTYQAPTHLMMDNVSWYQHTLTLYPGDRISPPEMVQRLIMAGYEPVNWVSERGQFTRRGSVLDVYPVGLDRVVRLDWFDDELEKVYTYPLNSTLEKPRPEKQVSIPPAFEWIIPTDLKSLKVKLQENHRGNFLSYLKDFQYRPELYQIMPFFHPTASILDCLPQRSLLVWPEGIWYKSKAYAHMLDETALQRQVEPVHLSLELLKTKTSAYAQQQLTGHDGQTQGVLLPPVEQQLDKMASQMQGWLRQERQVTVVTPQPQRVVSILQERNCPVSTRSQEPAKGQIQVLKGNLPAGFAFAPLNWYCFTDRELFQQAGQVTRQSKRKRRTSPLQLSQLRENMLVVHEIHGIGRYQGLVQYNTTGETREYLAVSYAGTDRLLVPVEQMHRLQIYQGVSGDNIKLHKLGGGEWEKAKAKVKKNLVEIAEQLLKTEASRLQAEGVAYPEDTEWQREMEFAFPYEETPDQLQAILDTKEDMEKPQPMNRLICGDVGFGKTEVALRAAFKAAISGYQVALLAPTTILAHQHYQVLKDRFAPYPVRVELLSRYRTQSESDRIFADLKAGAVDIVVATHRLLSKKLNFHKLGLLIIDEEHRFGVGQKEKLKQLAPGIDILTMSATPIPRTLNIAMGGLKSLSLIETPPPNRQPIKTVVGPYNEETIKNAIYQELQRGGQVYYIHNRVKSIYHIGRKIEELVPQARVRVGHGQMSKQDLERTMWEFYHHDFDILVATTIVESGLDISNVNTLIIEDVELLGLAQIHQLRGRVGRSSTQAYAYLFHDSLKPLTREARERLTVVQEYSSLGSGYFLALKDMEIRGIGNLIGPQQHGNILTVGFDTYCQLLEETLAQLQGQKAEERAYYACVIDLNLSAYLPEHWISDSAEKMRIYRTLAYAIELEDIEKLYQQAIKQFGKAPSQAETLWQVTACRIKGNALRLEKIGYNGTQLEVSGTVSPELLRQACRKVPELRAWKHNPQKLTLNKASSPHKNLLAVDKLLTALYQAHKAQSEEQDNA